MDWQVERAVDWEVIVDVGGEGVMETMLSRWCGTDGSQTCRHKLVVMEIIRVLRM